MPALFALPPPDPAFELAVASQGTAQGIQQTDGIQIFPRAYVRFGEVQVGAQWRNISSPTADGVAALFVRYSRTFANGQLDAAVLYRIRTGAKDSSDSRAWEFSAGGRRNFGRLGIRFAADYSPKEFASGKSLYVEVGPSFDLDKVTRTSAAIGRRERDGGPDYTAFNAGLSRRFGQNITLDARYYDTNRSRERFRGRFVVSMRLVL